MPEISGHDSRFWSKWEGNLRELIKGGCQIKNFITFLYSSKPSVTALIKGYDTIEQFLVGKDIVLNHR